MKRFIMIIFIFAMLLSILTYFHNSFDKTNEVDNKTEAIEIYSYEELATLPLEKTYGYEDILKDMKLDGLGTEERIANFKVQHDANTSLIIPNSTATVRYGKFAMDSYEFTNSLTKYKLTPILYIGLYYTSNESPNKIASIDQSFLNTSGGSNCEFTGKIFYRLESGNSFYYGINGDVYKTASIFIRNIDFDGRYYSASLND